MPSIKIDSKEIPLRQERVEIPHLDLLSWLSLQNLYPKVYWKDRDRSSVRAAVGSLLNFSHIPRIENTGQDFALYGGIRFDQNGKTDRCWDSFPSQKFWLPQCEVVQNERKTELFVRGASPIASEKSPRSECKISFQNRTDIPQQPQWSNMIETLLNEIDQKRVEKVVAARKTILELTEPVSPWEILQRLQFKAVRTTIFAFEIAPGICFFGATPEKLFDRRGRYIETDAIAGTRPRGEDLGQDALIAAELLKNTKDQREFLVVKRVLEEVLSEYSTTIEWEGTDKILKNTHVQHIYNRLHAELKAGVSDAELVHRLHPTPALSGYPLAPSLSLINALEPFDRGWYGAPVGIIQPAEASFAVAIRSALLFQNSLHLFAGTGIVRGSEADTEWKELEHKIHPITSLLESMVLNG